MAKKRREKKSRTRASKSANPYQPTTADVGKQASKVAASSGAEPSQEKSIISPWIDFWCCGGLSIVVVVLLFIGLGILRSVAPNSSLLAAKVTFEDILILGFLINFPHFMASYRILYRKTSQIKEHSWASTYVPLLLLALIGYAFLTPSQDPTNPEFANGAVVEIVTLLGGLLLAWHYTGQAWGMTASFTFMGGIRMEDRERWMVRSGYYALMVLHLLWACLVVGGSPDDYVLFSGLFAGRMFTLERIFFLWWLVVLVTIPLGIVGFLSMRKRTGNAIPLRAWAPWIAIYMWYALISVYPGLFPFLQIFHALQYLIFPIRVEMNQHAQAANEPAKQPQWLHGAAYYFVLVAIGVIVFTSPALAKYIDDGAFLAVNALVLGFINIHHYVIDGAIWKIRNPAVRRDLFAHLQP